MKRKLTYKKWPGICLILLMLTQLVQAQYPKYLSQYPVVIGPGSVNTLIQKDNVVYLGGDFTSLGKKPLLYGFGYDKFGDIAPNTAFAAPGEYYNGTSSLGDGNGGFYVWGDFKTFGGEPRIGMAKINGDGKLSSWDAKDGSGFDGSADVSTAALIGSNIVVGGSFTNLGGVGFAYPLALLDGVTGQPLPGWNDLQLNMSAVTRITLSNNRLFIYGNSSTDFKVIDITDISHPTLIEAYKLDAQDKLSAGNGGPFKLNINQMLGSGGTVFLSAKGFAEDFSSTYQNQTLEGQAFDSHLFAVDAVTGKFIKAFNTGLGETDAINSLVLDGNILYMVYTNSTLNQEVLKAFNKETGEDVSTQLPSLTLNSGFTRNTQLLATSDHKLLLYGGFNQVNGANQNFAEIDLTSNMLLNWDIKFSFPGTSDPSLPSTIAESNGKYYIAGNIAFNLSDPVSYNGVAAINASTGELLPWKPSDFSGIINTMTTAGNKLYIGGSFSGNQSNLVAYDITDPANPVLKTDWAPNPDDVVNTLVANDSKLYVGGNFTNISDQSHARLAEFDLATGTLNTSWDPSPDDAINILAIQNNTLYVGGAFKNISSGVREAVAAFDLSAGNALTAWDPKLSDPFSNPHNVNALAIQPADGANHAARVFIGGDYFNTAGSEATTIPSGFAVVNTVDAALDPWQLNTGFGFGTSIVHSLALSGNKLYVGGDNFFNSADISGNFAQLDETNYLASDGSIGGSAKAILSSSNLLFVGGDFIGARGDASLSGLAVFQLGDIAPAISFPDLTKIYGDAPFSPGATSTIDINPITYTIADADNPDNVIALADGKITIVKPGVATVTASQSGAPDVKAKVTVNKAELTVHPKDATVVVNQPLTDFPFTITGWKLDDETKPGIYNGKPEFATTATSGSRAGTYEISVSGIGTLLSDYYTFTPSSTDKATLTINTTGSTTQTITFAALPAKTYGEADFEAGATTDGSGLTLQYSSSDENIATITNGKIHLAGAGTVTITASQHGDPTYAPATDVMQTLTIAKAPLTITADDKIKDRGTANPAFTATYAGLVNGDKATDLATAPAFSTTATATSKPGTYPITVADASSNNYNITYVNGTLTIRGTQIITWAPLSTLTYGDAPFNPGAVSDADAKLKPVYTTSNPAVISIENGQAVIKGAGTATITATFAAANGFDLTISKEDVTVLKRPLVITADNKTRNYGDANPEFTFTYNGFVGNDKYNTPGVLTASPVASTTATATSPAGAYPITVNGATSNNYAITFLPGTLTISNLTRLLTFNAIPAKTYGNPDFDGASLNSGEQVVYTFSDPSVATVAAGKIHITGAGTTDITASAPVNSNYNTVTPVTQTLTVAKAPLIITANNLSKTQGPPDIALTASYNGFVNNDTQLNLAARPVLITTATTNSPTGTYPISINGASSPNYDITYQQGILTIILAVGQEDVIVNQALSPNGDGLNDYFQINGINNFPDNHVAIINRNGQKVYEVNGYDNATKAFTGKSSQDGNVLQQGTYFYRIEYKLNGQQVRKSGYLVLKY